MATPAKAAPVHRPRWYWIPARALLVTILVTGLSFALSLLLGIAGLAAGAKLRGTHADMTLAYRDIAIPAAAIVGVVVLVSALSMEIRHYRQAKALAEIERAN
jgi:hypothetical protein